MVGSGEGIGTHLTINIFKKNKGCQVPASPARRAFKFDPHKHWVKLNGVRHLLLIVKVFVNFAELFVGQVRINLGGGD